MAKAVREKIRLNSTAGTGHFYTTTKNKRTQTGKMETKKYDPKARKHVTYKEGKIPVNVDGGLLSKGHPIGATGGSQIRTIVLQLRGEAGEMQVPNPKIGLVHNIGGVGIYGNVTILGR